jgi:plastocyanin
MTISQRWRRATAVASAAAMLHACGGGGAAPLSEPNPPDAGGPPTGTPPATPPATPPSTPPAPAAPSIATVTTPNRTFSPAAVTIAANGTVTWQAAGDRHEIVFVGATPPGGNIGELEEGSSASRTFTTAGTYEYECLRHRDKGMRGTVVVQGSSAGAPPPNTPPPSGSTATVTTPNATFSPSDVSIPVGGSVTWQFSEARHNVTFQGAAPAGGSIPDQDPGTSTVRTFAAPGTYNYACTRHAGMSGRVTVQ